MLGWSWSAGSRHARRLQSHHSSQIQKCSMNMLVSLVGAHHQLRDGKIRGAPAVNGFSNSGMHSADRLRGRSLVGSDEPAPAAGGMLRRGKSVVASFVAHVNWHMHFSRWQAWASRSFAAV